MEKEELIERFAEYMLSELSADKQGKLVGYEKPYLFTNERLDLLLKRLKPTDKRVLTTGSSGDQVIYAIANGARDITLFDLCPFAKVYTDYKIAMFKSFSFEQMRDIVLVKKEMFSSKTYQRISHNLPQESREFWDQAFLDGFDYKLMPISTRKDAPMEKAVYLLNPQEFKKIKLALMGNYSLKFINTHLKDLPKNLAAGESFDIILLSNIIKFVDKWEDAVENGYKSFWTVVKDLSNNHLNKGGVMQIDYRYFDMLTRYKYYSDLLGKSKVSSSGTGYSTGAILYRPNKDEQIAQEI